MKPGVIWWPEHAMQEALEEADIAHPQETGGILLGWRTSRTEVVVTHLVGPGPLAERTATSFKPDADWQQDRIDEVYEASGRTVAYLGDWHTHPKGTPVLSRTDLRTLRRIARHGDARMPQPVMAVLAGGPEWRIAVRQPVRPRARRTQPLDITLF